MGHAIREMMRMDGGRAAMLDGIVEIDEAYIGGRPKKIRHVFNPPGRGTNKPITLACASRDGQIRVTVVPSVSATALTPVVREMVAPTAHVMTDGLSSYSSLQSVFQAHSAVTHSKGVFAKKKGKIHVNTVEAFFSLFKKAYSGVYHYVSPKHLQRYLNQIAWRWNSRLFKHQTKNRSYGNRSWSVNLIDKKAKPFGEQLAVLLRNAVGHEVRRSANYGIRVLTI